MRDLLTVLAGLVVVALVAALAVPPFVDWEAHREAVDRAIGRAAGTEARTEGRLRVSLLPSPRLATDRLTLGGEPGRPGLDAHFLKAEIALTPLLSGEVRFTQVRVGRVELKLPTAPDGTWALPAGSGEALRRAVAFEDLFAAQAILTMQAPATGRTDQFRAEAVQVEGQSLAGPWRIEGQASGVPFRLSTGELADDGVLPAKLTGGGDPLPRFDIDAEVALVRTPGTPAVSGQGRVLFGSEAAGAGRAVPATAQATFKTDGPDLLLDPVSVEAGEGGGLLRLAGTGRASLENARLSLRLDGRRLDLDRLLSAASGWRERTGSVPLAAPLHLDLSLGTVVVRGEEVSDLRLQASLENGRVRVGDLRFAAAGDARVSARGEFGTAGEGPLSARVAVTAASTDRLARALAGLDGGAALAAFLDGRPLDAAADVTVERSAASLRDLRIAVGDALLTGEARYAAPDGAARGRLSARLSARGIDLSRLPPGQGAFDAARGLDLDLALDAQDVRYGGGPGAGRVTARVSSDGPAFRVDALEISDLAGANARVSGRIAADGSGRIEGRLSARRAAPLIDLLGGAGAGGVAKLAPVFLREGDLDVSLAAERAAPDPRSGAPALSTTLRGRAAGGPFAADLRTSGGRADRFSLRLETANTGLWLGRPDRAGLRRPAALDLKGERGRSGLLDLSVSGDLGGVRIATARPFALGAGDDTVESGELTVSAADLGPFLPLLGEGAAVPGPVAAEGRLTFDRAGDAPRFTWSGRVLGTATEAVLAFKADGAVDGTASLERLSLPWLAAAFALDRPADARSTELWSTARFGRAGRAAATGRAMFKVSRLDLGQGLAAENAAFGLAVNADGLSLRDLDAGFAGGRLSGQITISRQEGLASFVGEGRLRDAALPALIGPSPLDGRLGADLRFGASGETTAAVVSNLAGAGEVRLTDLRLAGGDPGALERALPRVLNESDPLSRPRLEALVAEELGRGPLLLPSTVAPASLVGGALRFGPLAAAAPGGTWQGTATLDLKTLGLDAGGVLSARTAPKGWSGPPPSVLVAWRGPPAAPARTVDVGPVLNGLAALVLQRELEKIEAFEIEANERTRFKGRLDHERDLRERERRAAEDARRAAEEAARQARLAAEEEARRARQAAEEAARRQAEEIRQARVREQQAAEEARQARLREQRAAAEEARQARLREQAEAERARAAPTLPPLPGPIEIRPAPPIGAGPGG